jgi:type VI secretion system protein VasD
MFDRAITRRTALTVMVSGLGAGLAACVSAPPPPPPTEVVLTVQADGAINPDPGGRPSPAQVHIYWLRGPAAFQRADFFALTGDPSGTLGADLAAHETVTLRPMSQQGMTRRTAPGVTHVGVVAAYRSLDGVSWRTMAAFPANARSAFNIQLGRNGVTMGQQMGPSAAVPSGPGPVLASR